MELELGVLHFISEINCNDKQLFARQSSLKEMKLYDSLSFTVRANKAVLKKKKMISLGCRSQWKACWHWQPRCILVAAVRRAPAARRQRCAPRCGGTTELWVVGQRRLALTAVGTERSTAAQISSVSPLFFFFEGFNASKSWPLQVCSPSRG